MQRRLALLAFLAGFGALVPSPTFADGQGPPTLFVNYNGSAPVVTLADGTAVGAASPPGTTIPAGTYDIDISVTSGSPDFLLTGPGVDLSDGETAEEVFTLTFAPSSTYSYLDGSDVADTRRFFSTSATVVPSPAAAAPVLSGTSQSNADPVGSATQLTKTVSLTGGVSARGALTFSLNGRPAVRLKAGRYTLTVADHSASAGFVLRRPDGARLVVSGTAFVGRRSLSLALSAGTWSLETGSGSARSFVVTS